MFLHEVLCELKIIDEEKDVQPWLDLFDSYDADGSGTLTREDLDIITESERERKARERKGIL